VQESDPTVLRPKAAASITEIVRAGACIGCGVCAAARSDAYGMQFDRLGMFKAQRTTTPITAREEAVLTTLCPFSECAENEDEISRRTFPHAGHDDPSVGRWESAYVGAVAEGTFRADGSSGGMMSWLLTELLRRDEIDGVIHVVPRAPSECDARLFQYRLSRTVEEIRQGAKSRYYPVEISSALAQVRAQPGRYAFVGLPCFVKAIRLLMRDDEVIRTRVKICLGLFCGHLKSAALVDSFALQSGLQPSEVSGVDFRRKQSERRADIYTAELITRDGAVRRRDWTQFVDGDWGMGFFQYSACNYCDDVMAETADVSFGDAWVPPYSADGRGTNVVVVRASWIDPIIRDAIQEKRVHLNSVDGDFLAQTQAAGLRQRREGLAYRLHKRWGQFTPRKRVVPDARAGGWKRRRIYDLRMAISHQSHLVFAAARTMNAFWIYQTWARVMRKLYRGIYWLDRGPLSERLLKKMRLRRTHQ
jgi:coenzyme F420-reducing hydrogenase beta subunit